MERRGMTQWRYADENKKTICKQTTTYQLESKNNTTKRDLLQKIM